MPEQVERTPLGIYLKKLRIDHDETMAQMGERIGMNQAYLSLIELGKRLVPNDLHKRIVDAYGLNLEQELFLEAAITQSDSVKRKISARKLIDEMNDMAAEANIQYKRTANFEYYIGYCDALDAIEKKIRNGEFTC